VASNSVFPFHPSVPSHFDFLLDTVPQPLWGPERVLVDRAEHVAQRVQTLADPHVQTGEKEYKLRAWVASQERHTNDQNILEARKHRVVRTNGYTGSHNVDSPPRSALPLPTAHGCSKLSASFRAHTTATNQ